MMMSSNDLGGKRRMQTNGNGLLFHRDSANKQKHHKRHRMNEVNQPLANIRANKNTMAQ